VERTRRSLLSYFFVPILKDLKKNNIPRKKDMDFWTRDPLSLLLLQMKKKRLRRRRRLSNTPPFPAAGNFLFRDNDQRAAPFL
jgi:hypothetical protein